MCRIFFVVAAIFSGLVSHAQTPSARLDHIVIETDRPVLNPVLHPQESARLSVRGIFSDGRTRLLPARDVIYSVKNKLASGRDPVLKLEGDKAIPLEGGMAAVTAVARVGDETQVAGLDIVVRPYYREYHQTLVLKLFLGMEGEPVERLAKDPLFQKKHDVLCTFEEALDVIRKTDNLTRGIPKIIYLVGWQKGGHDHQYPSWDTVNPKLKREQDSTALESLRWLIRAARAYHTTVSLHINMVDAYRSSPLWDEYVKKDVLAKDLNGHLLTRGIQIKGDSLYIVSYTREWQEGLAQQRIDRLIAMVPELKEGHTIHIDAFIDKSEKDQTLSPWHALPQNGGIDIYREAETQHKIFKYWRARGFDVTGEGLFWAHPPGEGFYGLQPMSWWYPSDIAYQMATPENLSARGGTDRHGDGDFRFGNSMHGEEIYDQDKINLTGFLGTFCRNTLPWYYLSRLNRLALIGDTLFYSGGVQAATEHGHRIIRKGNFILRDDDDLFVPALWKKKEIIAYSQQGYASRSWMLPADWRSVQRVDIFRITLNGTEPVTQGKPIRNGRLELSLQKQEAVSIVPAGQLFKADTVFASDFGIKPDTRKDMTLLLQQAVDQCSAKPGTVLIFRPGRYDFWPAQSTRKYYYESNTTNDSVKYCATLIKDITGFTLDGRNADFIYHGRVQPFTIDSSRDISIKNIRIDWDIPLTAQAGVIDTGAGHIDLKIDRKAYPFQLRDHQLIFTGEGWEGRWWGSMAFGKASHQVVPQTGDQPLGDGWESYHADLLSNGLLRISGHFPIKAAPGNILVMRHNERDHAGIFITNSASVSLKNITLYYACGLGILSQYSKDLSYTGIRIIPNARKKRYFSGHDDGMHFSNCRGLLLVENCEFQGLMDDPINVHGTSVKIIRKGPGNELLCRFMHAQSTGMEWARPGDSVGMIDHQNMQTIGHNQVSRFSPINETDFVLGFSAPLPDQLATEDGLENLSWTPDLTIRHCRFGSNRARGLLISTPGKVRVEDNSFASSGSAILIAGDANYWFESGAVKDVLIRHNVFLSPCLTSLYGGCEAIVSIDPEIPRPGPHAYHRNIRIEENIFHPFDYPVLYAKSVDGLLFKNNILIRSHEYKLFHYRKNMITLVRCRAAVVQGNILKGDVLGRDIVIEAPIDPVSPKQFQFRYSVKGE